MSEITKNTDNVMETGNGGGGIQNGANGGGVGTNNGVGPSTGWNSWSALKAARRRHPVRLSASVDSIPYMDNDFFSSIGSLSNYPGKFFKNN